VCMNITLRTEKIEKKLTRGGTRGKILNKLTEDEVQKLQASADKLKSVIAQIEF